MKQYLVPGMMTALLLLATQTRAADWSPWAQLDDGALNGVEFSHRSVCPVSAKNPACTLSWRFLSSYDEPVDAEYTLTWVTAKGMKTQSKRVKLQPGENSAKGFSVTGTELDGVTVRIVADAQTLAAARQALADAKQREEDEQRLAKEQQEQRLRDRQKFAAVTRKEQERRAEEVRRKEDEAKREQARRAEQARLAKEEEERRQQEEEEEAQERARRRERQQEEASARSEAMWTNVINTLAKGVAGTANNYVDSQRRMVEMNREFAEEQQRQQEERERRSRQAAQARRERDDQARRDREAREQERVRLAQAETERQETLRRQQAEEQERRRADQAERERQRAEDEAKWEVGDFKATSWGCDPLFLKSGVGIWVTDSKGKVQLSGGHYVTISNPSSKYAIQYSVGNSNYTDRTLGPGQQIIVPLNIPANGKGVDEAMVRIRYHAN